MKIIKNILLVGLITFLIAPYITFADDPAQILKVRSFKSGIYEDVVVVTNKEVKPKLITLDSPKRLVIVFPNTNMCDPATMKGKTSLIRNIKVFQYDNNTVYVSVEPNKKLNYSFGSTNGDKKFVLEFSKAESWSIKTIDSSTSEVKSSKKNKQTTPGFSGELFRCVILNTGKIESTSKSDIN